MPHIFISYSSKHRPLTERLAAALEAEGWPVWWDHALEAHSSFRTQIDQAINDAAAFMVIWNKEAAASGFVLGEVQTARRRGQLINLRPLDFDIDDVPAEYRNIDHLLPLDFNHLAPILKTVETVWAGRVPEGMKPLWLSHRDLHGVDLFDPKQTPLPRPENPNPTDILQARHEVVPYIDAAGILADTLDWVRNRGTYAARPRPAAGRLFHGPGGFGKTRAMIEAARILRGEGWLAGFYPPLGAEATEDERKHRRRAMEQAVFAEGPERGILILVDYAESRADVRAPFEERRSDDITWLIRLIRRRPEDARPLRLVLLARGDAWWPDVFRAEPEVQALFDRTGAKHGDVIAADALPDGETRLKLFDATRTAYAAHLGTDPPLPPERRARIATDPTYARPLALQMEALLSLMGGVANTVDELLKGVLGLEHLHWTNVLGTLSDKQVGSMRRGLSQVTLVGSVDGRGAAAALLKADAYYPDRSTADLPLSDLRRLYGLGKHGVAALEPDLIGEHEVASVGEDDGEALVDACLAWIATLPEAERAHRRQLLFTVLQRATRAEHGAEADEAEAMLAHVLTDPDADTITDLVSVAIETPGRLAALLEQAAARLPPAALSALEDAVPAETIALAGVADAAAAVREGQARSSEAAIGSQDAAAALSKALRQRGYTLQRVGRQEEALAVVQEDVAICRRLAANSPDAFEPDLAASLCNLGGSLSVLGRWGLALAVTDEGTAIHRRLAATRPDAFEPGLAQSLNNLGNTLQNVGRLEEALAATEEAVGIRRRLAGSRPTAFEADLATGLSNFGEQLSELGRLEEALAATEEAVAILRRLAASCPDAFDPALASSLNNLGKSFSNLGRWEEAMAATKEAIAILRRLAAIRPDAFDHGVAMSLGNLGVFLAKLGRWEEALAASEESAAVYRRLAATRPAVFEPYLADNLNNLGNRLSGLGRREEALAVTEDGVAIDRRLAATRPAAFEPRLASSLHNLGLRLSNLGRREEALAAVEEAVAIRFRLVAIRPEAFEQDLASSLTSFSVLLSALKRWEEAREAAEKAVVILRRLAVSRKDAVEADLANSLSNLGTFLSNLGKPAEALAATEAALDIRRRLTATHPDAYAPVLAISISNLGTFLSNLGRQEEGLAATEEAVAIRRRLADTSPDAFEPDLARSLNNLSAMLRKGERDSEALVAAEDGLTLLAPHAERHSEAHRELMDELKANRDRALAGLGGG